MRPEGCGVMGILAVQILDAVPGGGSRGCRQRLEGASVDAEPLGIGARVGRGDARG